MAIAESGAFEINVNLGKSIASIQKNPIIYMRRHLSFYVELLKFIIHQYEQCFLPPKGTILYHNGLIELNTLIIDLNQQITSKQQIYSWTSITLPKIFSTKELYFIVASPESENITLNPAVTKGGWLSGSFSFPLSLSCAYALTGVSSTIYMLPFIPYKFPMTYVDFSTLRTYEVTSEYGSIQIIKQRNFLFLGIIRDLSWKSQRDNKNFILKAMFVGNWLGIQIPEAFALRLFNNTRFSIQDFEFSINIQNINLTRDNKILGSLSTVSCDQMPPNLSPENLPNYLVIQFELVSTLANPDHLLFSCNPKLFFTGDILNSAINLQHSPNHYELTVYAPHNLHFYPSCFHIVTLPIQFSSRNDRQMLVSSYPNEGYFEVQMCPWVQNSPLQIVIKSFSKNLVLPQGTPIAILLYMEKMTTGKNSLQNQELKINKDITRIGNVNLPKENFLHYNS